MLDAKELSESDYPISKGMKIKGKVGGATYYGAIEEIKKYDDGAVRSYFAYVNKCIYENHIFNYRCKRRMCLYPNEIKRF